MGAEHNNGANETIERTLTRANSVPGNRYDPTVEKYVYISIM
jgi:hypothetical protein